MFRWAELQHIDTPTAIQRAARFFYAQRLCFGGMVSARTFDTSTTTPARVNLLRLEEKHSEAHIRLAAVQPGLDCVQRYNREHTLLFCDPVYYETEGYSVPFPLIEIRAPQCGDAGQGRPDRQRPSEEA